MPTSSFIIMGAMILGLHQLFGYQGGVISQGHGMQGLLTSFQALNVKLLPGTHISSPAEILC